MSEVITPQAVEQAIRECSNRLAKSIPIRSERLVIKRAAERDYRRAYDRAYLSAEGPVEDRKAAARVATEAEHDALDVADIAHREAEALARVLEKELDALRSIGTSVRSTYAVAGRGEGL
jgi:hypothetical protein